MILLRTLAAIAVALVAGAAVATPSVVGPKPAMSVAASRVVAWVKGSGDNAGLPFIVVDKVNARLTVFDAHGVVQATTPVLLGLARGDDSPPGIGDRKLSDIAPAERITPAGRFVMEAGKNMAGKDIVWIDYDAAVSLHRASDRKPGMGAKSRVERLASATPAEKRVSLGCVNVATAFYDSQIQPVFGHSSGIAYILPETRSEIVEFAITASAERTAAIN